MKNKKKMFKMTIASLSTFTILATSAITAISCFNLNKYNGQDDQNKKNIKQLTNVDNSAIQTDHLENRTLSTPIAKTKPLPKAVNVIRFGHWNVLNQGGNNDYKSQALAKIILFNNIDVIALTEINAKKRNDKTKDQIEKPVADIVKFMNQYESRTNKNRWSFRLSNDISSKGNENQAERVAFIYDKTKLKPVNDGIYYKNSVNADILFDQHFKNNATNNKKIAYSRPPFGLTFSTLDNKFDFTMVVSHLDSPGVAKQTYKQEEKQDFEYHKEPIKTIQGTREINEAYQLGEVMKFMDEKDGSNKDLFFLGDTNIKFKNEAGAFAKLLSNGYISLLKESDANKTSLAKNYNKWSQPYDKIFAKTDSEVNNASKYNLWSALFDSSIINEEWIKKALNHYYKKSNKDKLSDNQIKQIIKTWAPDNEANFKYYAKVINWISDHTLTFADLEIDPNDKLNEQE